MKIRVALQGRIREFTVLGGAAFIHGLEPPRWHRPRGTGFDCFVVRVYVPVKYDPATDTATCIGMAEYWL